MNLHAASFLLWLIAGSAFALVTGPILVVIMIAFSAGDYFAFPLPGISTR